MHSSIGKLCPVILIFLGLRFSVSCFAASGRGPDYDDPPQSIRFSDYAITSSKVADQIFASFTEAAQAVAGKLRASSQQLSEAGVDVTYKPLFLPVVISLLDGSITPELSVSTPIGTFSVGKYQNGIENLVVESPGTSRRYKLKGRPFRIERPDGLVFESLERTRDDTIILRFAAHIDNLPDTSTEAPSTSPSWVRGGTVTAIRTDLGLNRRRLVDRESGSVGLESAYREYSPVPDVKNPRPSLNSGQSVSRYSLSSRLQPTKATNTAVRKHVWKRVNGPGSIQFQCANCGKLSSDDF